MNSALASVIVLSSLLSSGCGSSEVTQSLSAEDRFELGKKNYDDGNYLEAITDFQVVKLQFPGSAVADDAQYYLGGSHYNREEYLLAIEEYRALKRGMAASPLVPDAQYKIAYCYYELAPRSTLDQQYSLRAIDEFQTFIEYYPKHEHVADAEAKIQELNTRLARKLFESAELYMGLEYFRSASIYYQLVIEKYHDSPFAEPAQLGLARSFTARRKYNEAAIELEKFFERHPNSPLRYEAETLRITIEGNRKSSSAAGKLPNDRRLLPELSFRAK